MMHLGREPARPACHSGWRCCHGRIGCFVSSSSCRQACREAGEAKGRGSLTQSRTWKSAEAASLRELSRVQCKVQGYRVRRGSPHRALAPQLPGRRARPPSAADTAQLSPQRSAQRKRRLSGRTKRLTDTVFCPAARASRGDRRRSPGWRRRQRSCRLGRTAAQQTTISPSSVQVTCRWVGMSRMRNKLVRSYFPPALAVGYRKNWAIRAAKREMAVDTVCRQPWQLTEKRRLTARP